MAIFNIDLKKNKDHVMAYLHNHIFYEMYFQLDGYRRYFCNNRYYELSKNILVVTQPHVLHKFEGGPYERILISLPKEFLPETQSEFLDKLHDKGAIKFKERDMAEIKEILNKLLQLNSSITKDNQLQISLTLSLLLHKIYYAETTIVNSTHSLKQDTLNYQLSPIILKIMDYIQNNYNQLFTYNDLCRHFNLSKAWICKGFLQANGLTVFQYKLALQLNEAQRLLNTSYYSIEKISELLGFSSVNYFCKVFKSHFSITPLQYRKSRRNIIK